MGRLATNRIPAVGRFPMEMAEGLFDAARHELAADVIRTFGEIRLRANGTSMFPAVWPGDILTVRSQRTQELLPGKILLCYRDGRFFAHRFIGIRGEKVITQGDSHAFEDPAFREEEVLGEVISIQRRGRVVPPSRTWWQIAGSWMMSRSDVGTRILLRLLRSQRSAWVN